MCENAVYWKAVPDFPGYECSSKGEFRRGNRMLKTSAHEKGYRNIRVYKGGKQFTFRAHRLIFLTFVGLSPNQEINHKNGIKSDNSLDNLEVCTHSENILHAYKTGLQAPQYGEKHKLSTPIVATNMLTGEVLNFASQACAKRAGFNQGNIQAVLSGKRLHHKNYFWSYA